MVETKPALLLALYYKAHINIELARVQERLGRRYAREKRPLVIRDTTPVPANEIALRQYQRY